ncbi:MAG TPA: FAD-binding protein, partial [Gemmatimonadales bacterium]|nr:FAD-binding protein [Gemmatimonadales bacterium]
VPLDQLAVALAAHGAFLALDPPGEPYRTLGGALAAAAPGPLAARFGPPRDQVLGLTAVAGNGTVFRTGGRVVKNVAGFDLAKVVIGGHGAFGIIRSVHLRLRALPAEDLTAGWVGTRERVAAAAARLLAAGAMPAAMEVVSPALAATLGIGREWTLMVRALGTPEGVEEELDWVDEQVRPAGLAATDGPDDVWGRWRPAVGSYPVLVRIGADPGAWTAAADLAVRWLGDSAALSVTVPRGTVRACAGEAEAVRIQALRRDCAARGWPVTLERGPAELRRYCGIWGELPPGLARLTERVRAVFDPNGVFAVPLSALSSNGTAAA